MNYVLRIKSEQGSFVIKQARPWVEKFPQLAAPVERVKVEALFYDLVQRDPFFSQNTPRLLGWDPENHVLAMEDLGEGSDFLSLYQKGQVLENEILDKLTSFISHLHNLSFEEKDRLDFPENKDLRLLNHEHIFDFPYQVENGFDLNTIQPGLQELAMTYKTDATLKARIAAIGLHYLGRGNQLIQGDYYPGSWLKAGGVIYVIDPEFAFFGPAEFDVAVFVAHLKMAQIPEEQIRRFLVTYQRPPGFDNHLCQAFSGVEIMRRLIGIAQVPVDLNLEEKRTLMDEAKSMIN